MSKANHDILKVKTRKSPGTIMYTGKSALPTTMTHYTYRNNKIEEVEDLYTYDELNADWISVEGFTDIDNINKFCQEIGMDNLLTEDIFNVTQRNKFITTKEYLFAIIKYPFLEEKDIIFRTISFVLSKGSIVTFTDYKNPFSEEILSRINNNKAMISKYKEDYLLYVIYDIIVDDQLELIKIFSEKLSEYELNILELESVTSSNLYSTHKNLVLLRNNIKSLKENLSPDSLVKSKYFSSEITKYMVDLDDHLKNLIEKSNTNIEICNSLIMMYSNQLSNRTNEIMKTLTIISVVFIPLSFFAGVFGMNFTRFAFLSNPYGLVIFTVLSVSIILGMVLYFKQKKWF